MGDKIPLTNEQVVKVEGLFSIQETYSALKDYLENDRHYDWSEKDTTEKNKGNSRYLYSIMEGEFPYSDYLRIFIQCKIEFQGEDVIVEENGKKIVLVNGKAKMVIFAFGEADWMEKRKSSPLMTFVAKMTDKYYGKDGMKKFKAKGQEDVDGTIKVFKQYMNARINLK